MTNAEQLKNCRVLLDFWDSVLPKMVSPGLSIWLKFDEQHPCGGVACLGGHVAHSGLFEGVVPHIFMGCPLIADTGNFLNTETYFGDADLFRQRDFYYEDSGSDHAVARARIVRAIERLEGVV